MLPFRKRTIEEKRAYHREWYQKNKERHKDACKRWREKNGRYYKKALSSWNEYFPKETGCGVCGKKIYFNKRNTRTAIHFDHRNNNKCLIEGSPTKWLSQSKRTLEREKLWEACNFGMLCEKCNRSLPSKNRKVFLINALKYTNAQLIPMKMG